MAATSWPPNAGFQATKRPLSTSRATASLVSPALSRTAVRPLTSRPHVVLGDKIAHGFTDSPHAAAALAASCSSTPIFCESKSIIESAPHDPRGSFSPLKSSAITSPSISSPKPVAALSNSWVNSARSGSTNTPITSPVLGVRGGGILAGANKSSGGNFLSSAPRRVSAAIA